MFNKKSLKIFGIVLLINALQIIAYLLIFGIALTKNNILITGLIAIIESFAVDKFALKGSGFLE